MNICASSSKVCKHTCKMCGLVNVRVKKHASILEKSQTFDVSDEGLKAEDFELERGEVDCLGVGGQNWRTRLGGGENEEGAQSKCTKDRKRHQTSRWAPCMHKMSNRITCWE